MYIKFSLNTLKNAPIKMFAKRASREKQLKQPTEIIKINKQKNFITTKDAIIARGINFSNTKNRIGKKIEFESAKTLEESINFGKSVLGVKNYNGFCESDIGVINWINNGLVYINNATKGKVKMPVEIIYMDKIAESQSEDIIAGGMNSYGKMYISREHTQMIQNFVKSYFEEVENKADFVKQLDAKKNFTRWMNAFIKIINLIPEVGEEIGLNTYTSTYSLISHEMGHLQHCVNTKSNLFDLKINFNDIFLKSKNIAERVSKNATKSPTEFVAECFAKMVDGIKLDDVIMELYKKLGGLLI